MEWYVWLIIAVSTAMVLVTLIIGIVTILKVNVITRNTVDSSLKMTVNLMYESDTSKEYLNFTIFNTNFRDITIRDFGIDYRNQHFNFVNEYMQVNKLNSLPVVSARSSISFRVDPQRLENFILVHNYKSKKISNIYNIVVDSVGNNFIKKNFSLTHILSMRQKDRVKQAKIIYHNEKVDEYKKYHDNREPMSHFFWKMFHSSNSVNPKIMQIANSFADKRTFTKIPEQPIEPVSTISSTITPATSGEIKLTYLVPEKPKKSKKKVEKKVEEEKVEEKVEEIVEPKPTTKKVKRK